MEHLIKDGKERRWTLMGHILQQGRIEDYSKVRAWATKRAEASMTCKDHMKTHNGRGDQVTKVDHLDLCAMSCSSQGREWAGHTRHEGR